jgi:transcriptional regulator with XRE-family HTH domain
MANSFGEYLQQARLSAKLGLRELAKKAGIAPSYLSDIENDRRVPSEDVLKNLARHLDLEVEELLGRAGRMGGLVERYVQREPAAGVLFRKIAEKHLDGDQLDELMKRADELASKKPK